MRRESEYGRSDWTLQETVPALGAKDFEQIRQLAHGTFGLDLKPGKEELVSARLRRVLRSGGFPSFQAYYAHVLADRTGAALAAMIDALATNHTSFLREPDHFAFLRETVAPQLAGRNPLEVWCAASSTGEEVYTIAIVLSEALPAARISIMGTDISNKALQTAAAAEYGAERFQGTPPGWVERHFVPDRTAAPTLEKTYRVAPRIRSMASFKRVNLVGTFSWARPFPVIFCRNVMIYFDRATQEKVVSRLAEALEPGGYLFVGHAESLSRVSHSLEYVRPAVYRKAGKRGGQWTRSW